jgi:hypothetical protein
MRLVTCLAGVALAASVAFAGGDAPPKPEWMRKLPAKYRAGSVDLVADAIQIWRLGPAYIPEPFPVLRGAEGARIREPEEPFIGIDERTRAFLDGRSHLESAVQFSCASVSGTYEQSVRAALEPDRPGELRLLALAVTIRVRAPRSVALQWSALRAMDALKDRHPGVPWLLEQLRAEFAPEAIDATIADEHALHGITTTRLQWAARAAGVAGHHGAIPRLESLAVSDILDVSLAAEASLEDLPGERADNALAACVLGWRYDAYVRAGATLVKRNPKLLEKTLLDAKAPEKCRYWQGLFLGRLKNAAAVPILCDTVGTISMIDGEMFDLIQSLATKDQLPLVEELPGRVREDQRDRARKVVESVKARLQAK